MFLNYVPFTKERYVICMKTLVRGNKVLRSIFRKHSDIVRKKLALQGRKRLPASRLASFLINEYKSKGRVVLGGSTVPTDDIKKLLAIEDIKCEILESLSRLFSKVAHKWDKIDHGTTLRYDDFYNEAVIATINALYRYKGNVRFITYAYTAINNRIFRAVNDNKPLSHLTNKSIQLLMRFNQFKAKYNDYVTFDTIAKDMKLSQKEISILQSILVNVKSESSLRQDEDGVALESIAQANEELPVASLDPRQLKALNTSGLNPFELLVIKTFIHSKSDWGWQTEAADKSFNPKTGTTYSKQHVSNAFKSAREKILRAYNRAA